ncbi:MAG: hypothetical protein WC451_02550 [Patescibacteria group bacterium]
MTTVTTKSTIGTTAYVLPILTYDNAPDVGQTLLWNILRSDPTLGGGSVLTRKLNVLDKKPEEISSGTGYPYLIVPIPRISEEFATFVKKILEIEYGCELYALQTKPQREMIAAIRKCIRSNISLFGTFRLEEAIVDSDWEEYPLKDGKMAYKSNIPIRFVSLVNSIDGG